MQLWPKWVPQQLVRRGDGPVPVQEERGGAHVQQMRPQLLRNRRPVV